MDQHKIYPIEYSDMELTHEAAELSKRVTAYDIHAGNAEDLIKDSVLFNVAYIELQNRKAQRVSRLMVWLSCLSAAVAAASLLVAWFAYDATQAGDKWQGQQIRMLGEISTHLSAIKELQQKAAAIVPRNPTTSAQPKKSAANSTVEKDARKSGARPSP